MHHPTISPDYPAPNRIDTGPRLKTGPMSSASPAPSAPASSPPANPSIISAHGRPVTTTAAPFLALCHQTSDH